MATAHSFPIRPELIRLVESIVLSPETGDAAHRVLPGPFPVFGLQLRGRMRVESADGWRYLSPAGITGICTGPRLFAQTSSTRTILVRLMPWALPILFGQPANLFADAHESLAAMLPAQRRARGSWEGATPASAVESVQAFLVDSARRAPRENVVAIEGARHILRRGGNLRLRDLETALGWSRRHIERVFLEAIGVSPKAFAAIVRFRRAERALRTGGTLSEVALDHGYYDQSHLANEFRRFSGQVPSSLR